MTVADSGLKIKTKFADENGQIMIVALSGYLDQTNSGQLEKIIDDIYTSECYKVIFDFEELQYLSSAGWGVFVGEIARFRLMGGDFKLVKMAPDVYRVYEMLEFYHILEEFPSMEKALESFGVRKSPEEGKGGNGEIAKESKPPKRIKAIPIEPGGPGKSKPATQSVQQAEMKAQGKSESFPQLNEQDVVKILMMPQQVVPLEKLPTHEKIKKIIAEYPLISIFKIQKMLRHPKFGKTKVNIFSLYRMLKQMNLETREKRYRYYRSI